MKNFIFCRALPARRVSGYFPLFFSLSFFLFGGQAGKVYGESGSKAQNLPSLGEVSELLAGPFCHPSLKPWRLPVCGQTKKEFDLNASALNHYMWSSARRAQEIPAKAIEAGQAVFKIQIPFKIQNYTWGEVSGSGFFAFNNRLFITNFHVLSSILDEIIRPDWSEAVFSDQNGVKRDFRIKGVKFVSLMHDLAVLEIEGYDGPVLNFAEGPPEAPVYIIGHPEGRDQKILSVLEPFEAGSHYGVFLEPFNLHYDRQSLSGMSGGPMVNSEGKALSVFANMFLGGAYAFLLTKKADILIKNLDSLLAPLPPEAQGEINLWAAKDLIDQDRKNFIAQALSGRNLEARFMLFFEHPERSPANHYPEISSLPPFAIEDFGAAAAYSGHPLAEYYVIRGLYFISNEDTKTTFLKKFIEQSLLSREDDLLSISLYELAFLAYREGNRYKACALWEMAAKKGHPYIQGNIIFMPAAADMAVCEFSAGLSNPKAAPN